MRQRCKYSRDLRLELEQQRDELLVRVGEYVAGVGIDNRRAEALHDVERVFGKRDAHPRRPDAAAEVVVIEEPDVASDPRAVERAALQELRVIGWNRRAR